MSPLGSIHPEDILGKKMVASLRFWQGLVDYDGAGAMILGFAGVDIGECLGVRIDGDIDRITPENDQEG